AAYRTNALQIVDVSDKTKPRLVVSVLPDSGGTCIRTGVKDGKTLAYIGGYFGSKGAGVQIVDVTQPLTPITLGFVKFNNLPQAISTTDRYAYTVSSGQDGVQVLDISNSNSPVLVN